MATKSSRIFDREGRFEIGRKFEMVSGCRLGFLRMGVTAAACWETEFDDGGWYGIQDGCGAFHVGDDGKEFQEEVQKFQGRSSSRVMLTLHINSVTCRLANSITTCLCYCNVNIMSPKQFKTRMFVLLLK